MNRQLPLRQDSGDGDRGQCPAEPPSGSRHSTGLTGVTNPFRNTHHWANKWVEERVQGVEGLSFVDDLGWVRPGMDMNQVARKLETCSAESIACASRRDLRFDTAKTDAALITRRRGHKKHLWPKLTPKIEVRDGFIRFNNEATQWLGVRIDGHLTFKEHLNRCMKKAMAAAA